MTYTRKISHNNQEHIAVLSRDSLLLLDIAMTLRDAGYEVSEFNSFEHLSESSPINQAFKCAIVDIGRDPSVARHALERLKAHSVPLLLIHSNPETESPFPDFDAMHRIEKPFLPSSLLPFMKSAGGANCEDMV